MENTLMLFVAFWSVVAVAIVRSIRDEYSR